MIQTPSYPKRVVSSKKQAMVKIARAKEFIRSLVDGRDLFSSTRFPTRAAWGLMSCNI